MISIPNVLTISVNAVVALQLIIQVMNNQMMGMWTPFRAFSVSLSICMALNGGYKFLYFTLLHKPRYALKDIPIDFSIELLKFDGKIDVHEKEIRFPADDFDMLVWLTNKVASLKYTVHGHTNSAGRRIHP